MQVSESKTVALAARVIFDAIKSDLEATCMNQFVAIEPQSGEHFVGNTLSEAVEASRSKYPSRLVHTFRVGHQFAVHFGMQSR